MAVLLHKRQWLGPCLSRDNPGISSWIEQANIRELRGLLLATLQRWHDLP